MELARDYSRFILAAFLFLLLSLMTFTPVVFNFKTKKVDIEEEMTTEIMTNEV
jgi:hypothetical protein